MYIVFFLMLTGLSAIAFTLGYYYFTRRKKRAILTPIQVEDGDVTAPIVVGIKLYDRLIHEHRQCRDHSPVEESQDDCHNYSLLLPKKKKTSYLISEYVVAYPG
jgi:hypothetical protein